MSSKNIVDLRRKAPKGQQQLFLVRPPRTNEREPRRQRPLPLRARRRRKRALIALVFLVLLAAAAYGVSYASHLPRFNIRTIEVTGATDLSPRIVRDYVETILNDGAYHFISRSNVFTYPRALIERDLVRHFPRIAAARITTPVPFSTMITVHITERQQYALWCEGGQLLSASSTAGTDTACYSMDNSGFIFAHANAAASSTKYVFYGDLTAQAGLGGATSTPALAGADPIGQSFVPAHLPAILTLLLDLGQAGFSPTGAKVVDAQDFYVPLQRGYYLKASFGEDPGTLVRNLQLVLSSSALQGNTGQLEYIDLRFGDHVYYKLQGQAQQAG